MTYPSGGYPNNGPEPWQQRSWDWRAAGNFIGGGVGTGLIVFAALSGAGGSALAALFACRPSKHTRGRTAPFGRPGGR